MTIAGVVDSDTHVDETDDTWEYVEEKQYRPVGGTFPPGAGRKRYWEIEGFKRRRPDRDDVITGTTVAQRELLDVPSRIHHMDELGVETHVIYPTLFLQASAVTPEGELAVTRGYNQWLADKTRGTNGRLRWVFVPSPNNIEQSVADMRWAKDHGACGVLKKGDGEAGHPVYDPYFFPLYEGAERLDMPICMHTGSGRVAKADDRVPAPTFPGMGGGTPMQGVYELMANCVPANFKTLRFGAIEAGASWIPLVAHGLSRGVAHSHLYHTELPKELTFDENRVYIACELDENIPMLLQYISEDNLLIGSDYSHHDVSNEIGFVAALSDLGERGTIPPGLPRKIMCDNPKAFYGL
jgi:predicted TIM-barrel fold metal-dependent hydrolase